MQFLIRVQALQFNLDYRRNLQFNTAYQKRLKKEAIEIHLKSDVLCFNTLCLTTLK